MDNEEDFKEQIKDAFEEIKDTFVEGSYNSRWIEIETNHEIGKLVGHFIKSEDWIYDKIYDPRIRLTRPMNRVQDVIKKVAAILGKTVEYVEDCLLFAQTVPDLNMSKYDKTISWSQIKKDLRPRKEVKKELTVKRVKEIIIKRQLANKTTGNSERAFEDSDVLTAIDEYRPVEEVIKIEGEGE